MIRARSAVLAVVTLFACPQALDAAPAGSPAGPVSAGGGDRPPALTSLGRRPVVFEANHGQVSPQVGFMHRGDGFTLFLSPAEAVFALGGAPGSTVHMQIAGAREAAELQGFERTPGRVHYYHGSSPEGWIKDVPTFERVVTRGAVEGIDLVWRGSERGLEYDFVVAPGADPEAVRLRFQGATQIAIDQSGDLVLQTASGALVHGAPVLHQERGGKQVSVAGRYVLLGPAEVGFSVGSYDPTLPLVIDPTVAFASLLGGSGQDSAAGIATDLAGNLYVAGYTTSPDLPVTTGFPAGGTDVFVAKLDPTGATVFLAYLGGTSTDSADGIAVDSGTGEIYLAGDTQSADFPIVGPAYQAVHAGGSDLFACKLDAAGALLHSTFVGGSANDLAFDVALGPGPALYITGRTHSPDLPTTLGAFDRTLDGSSDAFLTVVAPGSGGLSYSTFLGGGNVDYGYGLAVDPSGRAYLTGQTFQEKSTSPKFPTTADAYRSSVQLKKNSFLGSIYLSVIDPAGNTVDDLVYSTFFMQQPGLQAGRVVAADGNGRAYVSGTCHDGFPTTPGALDASYNGGRFNAYQDTFLAVVDTDVAGAAGLVYSTYLGGYQGETPHAIAVEGGESTAPGTVHLAGVLVNDPVHPNEPVVEPFPTTPDAFRTAVAGYGEGFYAKLDPAGGGASDLLFCTLLGGDASEIVRGAALGGDGIVYLAGETDSSDFTPQPSQAPAGGLDAFCLQVEFGPPPLTPPDAPSGLTATAQSSSEIQLDWTDNASDEEGFELERSLDGSGWTPLVTLGVDVTSYADAGLAAGTRYYYRVRAFNSAGNSSYSNVADDTTHPEGGGGDALANGEILVAGAILAGSYLDTWSEDDVHEEIRERESGGKPSNRHSYLEHKWTFQVPPGSPVTLYVDAYHSPSTDGDDFVFAWSTDDASYEDAFTITATAPTSGVYQSFVLMPPPSGVVYVRVKDTDQTAGNRSLDTLLVDHLFIRSGTE